MSEKHIRDGLIDQIAAKLDTIQRKNAYDRDVARVYTTAPNGANIPSPAIVVTQGDEDVEEFVGPIAQRNCLLNITFVDNYAGRDQDGEALEFLADVQRALGSMLSFQYSARRADGGATLVSQNAQLFEQGSSLNYADSMRGKIYGTVSYVLQYRTSSKDPRRLP